MKELKPLGKERGSLADKVTKALGKSGGFELPIPSLKKKSTDVSAYHEPYNNQKEFTNALLEAERLKAYDIMQTQRHNSFR
ncbi:MAG: hypothetical protein JSW72_09850 [Candidatus Bathyarchaeota archaeon]|nr:MAG: hypothetical protein JSW72_09850 [Candidatus Bathyarchaeota archaeon]